MSLRRRLFRAIALTVVLCVGITVVIGLVLTRRAVDRATLSDVSHQADLIARSQDVHSTISRAVSTASSPRCSTRRRIALMRAASSRGENGFGT